jgi:hypothetical protein
MPQLASELRKRRVDRGVSGDLRELKHSHGAATDTLLLRPILITEIGSPLVLEGVNYVGDTLLFAAATLLAGFTA